MHVETCVNYIDFAGIQKQKKIEEEQRIKLSYDLPCKCGGGYAKENGHSKYKKGRYKLEAWLMNHFSLLVTFKECSKELLDIVKVCEDDKVKKYKKKQRRKGKGI